MYLSTIFDQGQTGWTPRGLWLHSPFVSALLRKKLAIRLQDAAEAMGVTNASNTSPERARHWLQLELRDALLDLGKACSVAAVLDQKQQHADKCLDDWGQRHEESQAMLDTSEGGPGPQHPALQAQACL